LQTAFYAPAKCLSAFTPSVYTATAVPYRFYSRPGAVSRHVASRRQKDADLDIPILKEAKANYAKLQWPEKRCKALRVLLGPSVNFHYQALHKLEPSIRLFAGS